MPKANAILTSLCDQIGRSVCLKVCAVAVLTVCVVAPANADLIHSKSSKFRIPFQFDAQELQRIGASEIQLYVTTDQGANWDLAQSVDPSQSKFTFEATEDGEHWFSVRTLTRGGLTYPPGPHLPSLQVLVDTTKPVFDLEVEEVETGRVRLSWAASDDRLDEESLSLEFLDPTASTWESVSVSHLATGQTSWTVANAGVLQVRGSVKDLAGNRTQAEGQVTMTAPMSVEPERPDFSRPVADMVSPAETENKVAETAIANQPISVNDSPIVNKPASTSRSVSSSSDSHLKPMITPLKRTEETPTKSDIAIVPQGDESPLQKPMTTDEPLATVNPKIAVTPPKSLTNHQLSKPKDTHLVNSRVFRVAYELESVGPSGVASVELYITEDRGNRWFHYGSDPDKMSPFEVQVPRDGDYGFAFRVRNGVGLIATPPQPGDEPEVRVSVDRAPPVAQLSSVREGQGKDQVVIEWSAQDRELDAHPIALYHARQPTGPWELIQGWTKNNGKLVWDVPSTFEKKLYIRLDVRDTAGNVTQVQTDRPFMLDQSQPKARVTDVESLRVSQ